MNALVAHYAEVGLKGRNRGYFEHKLARNIEAVLRGADPKIRTGFGRIVVDLASHVPPREAAERVARVFGVAHVGVGTRSDTDLDSIGRLALEMALSAPLGSFRIKARRAYSDFPHKSQHVNEVVGALVVKETGAPVDLKNPGTTIWIELFGNSAIIYRDRVPGVGGLPMGTSTKMLALLSGGIDSPVAAWRMARRGGDVDYVHFHAQPFTDESSVRQARRLVEVLTRYQTTAHLYSIPLADAQSEIVARARPELRVVLYRRAMIRIATQLAEEIGAKALITGDSVGQVASQTIDNLNTVDAAAPSVQVLRPLVAMDKQEIIDQAQRIGTFEISTRPYQDSCTLFEARSPATHAKVRDAELAEVGIDVDALTKSALAATEKETIEAPPLDL
jgi:thiamine biosynthesis protein ThiI